MDPTIDPVESSNVELTSPKARKTYENRRSHSDASKTISSPESELFTSPTHNNTSRYGRARKPKISEDFYNIEDILYPYERLSSPARSPKKKLSSTSKFENITLKNKDTIDLISKLERSPAKNKELTKIEISPLKNINLINLSSEEYDSEDTPLIEDNSDVSKVFKIVSDTSSNSSVFSPKGTTQDKSVKTYTNRKKRISETVIESFALPDYSPVLNGACIDIFQEHQYASVAKNDDLVVALNISDNKGEGAVRSLDLDSDKRTKSKSDVEKLKRNREQFKIVETNQIVYIQENNVTSPEKTSVHKVKSTKPNILRSSKVTGKKTINSEIITPESSDASRNTSVSNEVISPNILKSNNTSKKKLSNSQNSSVITPKKSSNSSPTKVLKDLKTCSILPKKLSNLKKTKITPKVSLNNEEPREDLQSDQKSNISLKKSNLQKSTDNSTKIDLKSPVIDKDTDISIKKLVARLTCNKNSPSHSKKTQSKLISPKTSRSSRSLKEISVINKKQLHSPKSSIINLKSSDILPKRQHNNLNLNLAANNIKNPIKVISHKIKNKTRVQKKYLSKKLNPKLKKLRSSNLINNQNVEVKSYKELVPKTEDNYTSTSGIDPTIEVKPDPDAYTPEVGSLAWSRVGNYPFWPSIITNEPSTTRFSRYITGRGRCLCYHVHFFGDNGRRSWVLGSHIFPFTKRSDLEAMALSVSKKSKPKDPKHLSAFIIHPNKLSKWETAVSESESLTCYPPEVRTKRFFELVKETNEKKRKYATIKTPSNSEKAHKRLKLDKVFLNSKKNLKTHSFQSSRSITPNSDRLSPEIKREIDEDGIIFNELDERALNKKLKNVKLGIDSDILDLEKLDMGRKLRKSVPMEPQKTPLIFSDDSFSDSDSKSIEDKVKTEVRETPSPIYYVSAAARQKQINVFKGVTKERVCNICGKGNAAIKCKGTCFGFYHIDCDKKIKHELEKSLAILAEDSDSTVDSDLEKQRSSSTETKDSSISEKSELKSEIATDSDINSNKPPDKSTAYNTESVGSFKSEDLIEIKQEEISNTSKDDINDEISSISSKTEYNIRSEDIAESSKIETLENTSRIDSSEDSKSGFKTGSGETVVSDEENNPAKRLERSISLAEKIDLKMQEVMEGLATQTKYTDSTTDESSESELSESSKPLKSLLKIDSADIKCEVDESNQLTESIDCQSVIIPKVTKRIIKHVTADGVFDVIQDDIVEEEIDLTDFSKFKCSHCSLGVKPPCFICGNDVAKSGDEKKHKCMTGQCGKYYHFECLKDWPQTKWVITSIKKNVDKENLYCPYHNCHTCISDDPRGPLGRYAHEKLAKCIRCPTTYHISNYCIPAGTEILSAFQIVCPKHIYKQRHNKKMKIMPHVNASWCFICSMGGSLICCETCPSSFHAECLKLNPPEGRYLCEECESGRLPLYDEIVWVKLGAYRWWPAQIIFPIEVPENVNNFPHNNGEFVVKFFGSHDYYWVNRGRVFLFQEGDNGHASSKKSTVNGLFIKAIDEAIKAHKIFQETRNERAVEARNGMKPPPFIKIKVNRPVGDVRSTDADTSNTTPCDCDPNWNQPCGPESDCLNRILMTECNPVVCAAGNRCYNQQFEKRQYTPVAPFKTPARGWGLKTLVAITKGTFVIEYVGEVINEAEYRRRIKRKHEQKDENYYFLTIDKDRMIDAGPKGNVARFMNHSCNPNCETQKWTVNGGTRVGLFAIMDVPQDAELTFNYNLECIGEEKKECRCEAPNCSGFIGVKAKQEEAMKKKQKSVDKVKTKGKKGRKSNKKKIKKLMVIEAEAAACFVCGDSDPTQVCDREACNKAYHLHCAKLENPQDGKWFCPWHSCNTCSKRTTRCCYMCTNSYCPLHSKGNIRYDRVKGFICSQHDVKDAEPMDTTDLKDKLAKQTKPETVAESDCTSTEKEDSRVSTPASSIKTNKFEDSKSISAKSSRRSSEMSMHSETNTIETELMSDVDHSEENNILTAVELKKIEENKSIMDDLRQIIGIDNKKEDVSLENKSADTVVSVKKEVVASRKSTRNSTLFQIIVVDSDEDLPTVEKSKTLKRERISSITPSISLKTRNSLPSKEISVIKKLAKTKKSVINIKHNISANEESSNEELTLAKKIDKSILSKRVSSVQKEKIVKNTKDTEDLDFIEKLSKNNSIKIRKISSESTIDNLTNKISSNKTDTSLAENLQINKSTENCISSIISEVVAEENKLYDECVVNIIEKISSKENESENLNTELKRKARLSLRKSLVEDEEKSSSEDNVPLGVYKKNKTTLDDEIEREDAFVEYAHLIDLNSANATKEKDQNEINSSKEVMCPPLAECSASDESSLITDSDSVLNDKPKRKPSLKKSKKPKKTEGQSKLTKKETGKACFSPKVSKVITQKLKSTKPPVKKPKLSKNDDGDYTPKSSTIRIKKDKAKTKSQNPTKVKVKKINLKNSKSPELNKSSEENMKKLTIDVEKTEAQTKVKKSKWVYLKINDNAESKGVEQILPKLRDEIQKPKVATELESAWNKKTKSTNSKVEETFLDRLKKLKTSPKKSQLPSLAKKTKVINSKIEKRDSSLEPKKLKVDTKVIERTSLDRSRKGSKSEDETLKSDKPMKVPRELLNLVRDTPNSTLNITSVQSLIKDKNSELYKPKKLRHGLLSDEEFNSESCDSQDESLIRPKPKKVNLGLLKRGASSEPEESSSLKKIQKLKNTTKIVRKSVRNKSDLIDKNQLTTQLETNSVSVSPETDVTNDKRPDTPNSSVRKSLRTHQENEIVKAIIAESLVESTSEYESALDEPPQPIETIKRKRGRPRKNPIVIKPIDQTVIDTTMAKETENPEKPTEDVQVAEPKEATLKMRGRPKKMKLTVEEPSKNVETITELYKMKLNSDQIPKNPYENHVNEVKLTANVPERHLRVVLRKHSEIDSKNDNKFLKMQNDIERDLPIRKRSKLRYEQL